MAALTAEVTALRGYAARRAARREGQRKASPADMAEKWLAEGYEQAWAQVFDVIRETGQRPGSTAATVLCALTDMSIGVTELSRPRIDLADEGAASDRPPFARITRAAPQAGGTG